MNKALIGSAAAMLTTWAHSAGFGADPVGAVPSGWTCGVTGRGQPRWAVAVEPRSIAHRSQPASDGTTKK